MGFKEMIKQNWNETAVVTDTINLEVQKMHEITEDELLPGELSASVFKVGCYTVRSAQRVYRIHEDGYSPELEMPADKAEVDLVRKEPESFVLFPSWRNKLRVAHEISAVHTDNPNNMPIYICRAARAMDFRWSEYIGGIYVAKEHELVPDEYASLFVCLTFTGSSHSFDTWYKLDPIGRTTRLENNSWKKYVY